MSADNGIYILKTKDQYRVAHLCAIDNVTWSVIDGDWCTDMDKRGKLVPTRVVEMWGNCKYTRNKNKKNAEDSSAFTKSIHYICLIQHYESCPIEWIWIFFFNIFTCQFESFMSFFAIS